MRHAVLALLLPMLGCPGDDQGETAASTAGSGADTAAPNTGEPEPTVGSSGTAEPSSTAGTSGEGPTTAGSNAFEACVAHCEHLVTCDVIDEPDCGSACEEYVGGDPWGCDVELLALVSCVAALSCEDAQAWHDTEGIDYPCKVETEARILCVGG